MHRIARDQLSFNNYSMRLLDVEIRRGYLRDRFRVEFDELDLHMKSAPLIVRHFV